MAEDTAAVLDAPASGDTELPEPQLETQPEISDSPELPESTEATASETDTKPPTRSIDELDESELLEHPRVKDVLARRQESARRQQEAETTRRLTQQAEQVAGVQNLRGSLKSTFDAVAQFVREGNELDPNYADRVAQFVTENAWRYHAAAATDWFNAALAAKMPEEYKFSAKEVETLRELHDDVATRRKDARELYEYRLDLYAKAAIAAAEPELHKRWETERVKREQSRARTDSLVQNEQARNGQPRPVAGGQSASAGDPRSVLNTAPPGSPAFEEAFKAVHGVPPPR